MKTKIFLLLIIAMMSGYIIYMTYEDAHHNHDTFQSGALEVPVSLGQTQVASTPVQNAQTEIAQVETTQALSHSHDGTEHSHRLQNDGALSSDDGGHHHIIPKHIKQNLCIEDFEPAACTVDLEKDLNIALLDQAGNLLADEITTVLDSKNFQDVLEMLSNQKLSNDAFVREDDYQHQLNQLAYELNITSSKMYCSESICAMTLKYDEPSSSKTFFEKFFNNSDKGNIFVSQNYSKEGDYFSEKVMFFPGNRNRVLVPNTN